GHAVGEIRCVPRVGGQEWGMVGANSVGEARTTMSAGLIYDPIFLEHETGAHPENPGRLKSVTGLLREQGRWDTLTHLAAEPAPLAALTAVHDPEYLALIGRFARDGGGMLTLDTVMSPRSYEVAVRAAGAALRATDAAITDESAYPFALVRPPGHHA